MEEKQIIEDVQFIKHMLENNQRNLVDNGLSYLINGTCISIGIPIAIYLGYSGHDSSIPYLWMIMMAIMIALNMFINKKFEKKEKRKTFGSELFKISWASCGVAILIVSILFFTTPHISASAFYCSIAGVLGVGYMLTGIINDLKFMKYLAVVWWAASILAGLWIYFSDIMYLGLFFSALVLIQQLVPGIIIFKKWRAQNNG